MNKTSIILKNKKAFFNFQILDTYKAGIQLSGTEVKSIRDKKVSFTDSYCAFINNELWLKEIHIAEYSFGSYNNHQPKRDRKLLLTKKELHKIQKKTKEKGLTIVPLSLFFSDSGFVKVEIGIAKGKKEFDKRESLKQKDAKRNMDKMMKY
jgi:SsrA-binding protein